MATPRRPLRVLPSTTTQDASIASGTDIPAEESEPEKNRWTMASEEPAAEKDSSEIKPDRKLPPKNEFVGPRILCLDGGGSRGIVMATVIERLEEHLNQSKYHIGKTPQNSDESMKAETPQEKRWKILDFIKDVGRWLGLLKSKRNKNTEDKTPYVRIWQLFDLIAGTSTGGLLAGGLGLLHMNGHECGELYEDVIPKVFDKKLWTKLKAVKYETPILEEKLKNHFKEMKMKPSKKDQIKGPVVAFTAFDMDRNKLMMFSNTIDVDERVKDAEYAKDKKNNTHDSKENIVWTTLTKVKDFFCIMWTTLWTILTIVKDFFCSMWKRRTETHEEDKTDITVVQALRATTAAPTYFKSIEINGNHYVDGGLGANCPAVKALRFANDYWNQDVPLNEISDPSEQETLPKMRTCELLVSLGTGENKSQGKPWESGTFMSSLIGWGMKIPDMITDSESIYEEAWQDLRRQNRYADHERLNPSKKIGKMALDSKETKDMVEKTKKWLKEPETKSSWLKTAHELIAKNYYVDVDTRNVRTDMKKYARISAMLRRGSFQCAIRQRSQLFAINKAHFEAKGTDQLKEIEITEDANNGLRLCIKPAWHVNDKAEVQVSVYFKPYPTLQPKKRYHIGGSPFTFTLYNPFKAKGMHPRRNKIPIGLSEKIAETLIVEPRTLNENMMLDLSKHFTDVQKAFSFGIVGLHVTDLDVTSSHRNNENDVPSMTLEILKRWSNKMASESEAYVNLVKALYAVRQEDLAREVLNSDFKPGNHDAKNLMVEPVALTDEMRLELSRYFTDAQELMLIGTYGLQLPYEDVRRCLDGNPKNIWDAAYAIFIGFRKNSQKLDEAYVDLVKALYAVGHEDLARSVLNAKFKPGNPDAKKLVVKPGTLTGEMEIKLSEHFTDAQELMWLGTYGLQLPHDDVRMHLEKNSRHICEASFAILRFWKNTQKGRDEAYVNLVKALYAVGREDLARSVLRAEITIPESSSVDKEKNPELTYATSFEMIFKLAEQLYLVEDIKRLGMYGLRMKESRVLTPLTNNRSTVVAAYYVLRDWLCQQRRPQEAKTELLEALRKVGRSDWAKSVLGMDPKLKEETTEDEDTDEDKVESLQNEDETERPERELTDNMILNVSSHFATEEDVRYFGIEGLHLPEYEVSCCITNNQGDIVTTAFEVLKVWFNTQKSREKALRELTNALLESRIFNKQTLREIFKK